MTNMFILFFFYVQAFSDALIFIEGGSSRDPEKVQCMVDNFQTILNEAHGYAKFVQN